MPSTVDTTVAEVVGWEVRRVESWRGPPEAHTTGATELWLQISVWRHADEAAGSGAYRLWRSAAQCWQLQEDLAREYPGYEPSAFGRPG